MRSRRPFALIAVTTVLSIACSKRDPAPVASTTPASASPSSVIVDATRANPSWSKDIMPHLRDGCAAAKGCHGDEPTDSIELDLRPSAAYVQLVGRTASARPGALLIAPGQPDQSFLVAKLTGHLGSKEGKAMPLDVETGAPKLPTKEDEAFVREVLVPWILAGAPND